MGMGAIGKPEGREVEGVGVGREFRLAESGRVVVRFRESREVW